MLTLTILGLATAAIIAGTGLWFLIRDTDLTTTIGGGLAVTAGLILAALTVNVVA